jgi:signal peptidase I
MPRHSAVIAAKTSQIALPRPSLRLRYLPREILETVVFVLMVYVLVELAAPRFLVDGPSMQPTFVSDQRVLISRLHYLLGEPERGDIVVFNKPGSQIGDPPLIKRMIGLPGDTLEIRDTLVYINGQPLNETYINEPCQPANCSDETWKLGADEYFVMGDNRNHSVDSRSFDAIRRNQIIGEAILRYWPPQDWALLKKIRFTN